MTLAFVGGARALAIMFEVIDVTKYDENGDPIPYWGQKEFAMIGIGIVICMIGAIYPIPFFTI